MEKFEDRQKYIQDAFNKVASFCAYQERNRQEVEKKLEKFELEPQEIEIVIEELMREKYLDEARYAESYAGGKFRVKKWGKIKIQMALKQKGLDEHTIEQGLRTIDAEDYYQALYELAEKKLERETEKDPVKRKQKLVRYLASKGYESVLVWDVVKEVIP